MEQSAGEKYTKKKALQRPKLRGDIIALFQLYARSSSNSSLADMFYTEFWTTFSEKRKIMSGSRVRRRMTAPNAKKPQCLFRRRNLDLDM